MSMKSFLVLCAATVAAVIVAILVVAAQPSYESPDAKGELVFPNLVASINTLKTVSVKTKDGTYTMDLNEGGWQFRERDNFAADDKKIAELVLRLARMQKLEAKTKVESSYERLDLGSPEVKDSRAKQVTLIDRDGKVMAEVIVGKRKFTLGSKEGGTYIRVPGDPQTWLALGELTPGEKARDWLKRDIADIKDKDLKRVQVTHPNGEKVIVSKAKPDDVSFKIQGIPGGREPSTDFVADEFGRVLTLFMLDDVDKLADVKFPADKTIKAEFEGFAGFKVLLDYAEVDGKHWVKVRGEAGAPSKAVPAANTPPPSAAAAPDSQPEAATDWAKVMADLNARADGWAFEVPAYEVAPLKKRMADVTKKIEAKS
ncbi:MAG: DUF4340 domain-containing protein [Rhodospirillaceae bacterium]|nr:DUF4340 domain-containing protein [Rhodospirillaceae bacterium]